MLQRSFFQSLVKPTHTLSRENFGFERQLFVNCPVKTERDNTN